MAKEELLEVAEEPLPSEKNETKKEGNQKEQLMSLALIVIIALLVTIGAFTAVNTKAVDKLSERVENLEKGTYGGNSNTSGGETPEATSYSTDEFKIIKPSDIKTESKNKTIVVLWARQSCGYCVAYAPILTEVARNHKVTIRYVDMESIYDLYQDAPKDEKEYNIMYNLTGDGEYKDYGKTIVEGTPGTIFIRNNKVIGGIIGYTDSATVEAAFQSVGL